MCKKVLYSKIVVIIQKIFKTEYKNEQILKKYIISNCLLLLYFQKFVIKTPLILSRRAVGEGTVKNDSVRAADEAFPLST
jgi:hypothetical protein